MSATLAFGLVLTALAIRAAAPPQPAFSDRNTSLQSREPICLQTKAEVPFYSQQNSILLGPKKIHDLTPKKAAAARTPGLTTPPPVAIRAIPAGFVPIPALKIGLAGDPTALTAWREALWPARARARRG